MAVVDAVSLLRCAVAVADAGSVAPRAVLLWRTVREVQVEVVVALALVDGLASGPGSALLAVLSPVRSGQAASSVVGPQAVGAVAVVFELVGVSLVDQVMVLS